MCPLTIIYLLHNFHNSNSWIIRFLLVVPFRFELDKFDCSSFFKGLPVLPSLRSALTFQNHHDESTINPVSFFLYQCSLKFWYRLLQLSACFLTSKLLSFVCHVVKKEIVEVFSKMVYNKNHTMFYNYKLYKAVD